MQFIPFIIFVLTLGSCHKEIPRDVTQVLPDTTHYNSYIMNHPEVRWLKQDDGSYISSDSTMMWIPDQKSHTITWGTDLPVQRTI